MKNTDTNEIYNHWTFEISALLYRATEHFPRCPANKTSRSASSLPSASPNIHPSTPQRLLRPWLPAPLLPLPAVSPAAVFLALEAAALWCPTGFQVSTYASPSLPTAVRWNSPDVPVAAIVLGLQLICNLGGAKEPQPKNSLELTSLLTLGFIRPSPPELSCLDVYMMDSSFSWKSHTSWP